MKALCKKIGKAIYNLLVKIGNIIPSSDDTGSRIDADSIKLDLKSISMDSMVKINELLKNCTIKRFNVGFLEMKTRMIKNELCGKVILNDKSPVITIKANCEVDRKKNMRTMKVKHVIRTLGVDNNLWEVMITTYCQCVVYANDWDQLLIQACNIYCDGLIKSNQLSQMSQYELVIPNIENIDIIQKRNYDGYIMTYGDNEKISQFIPYTDELSLDQYDNDELQTEDVVEASLESYKKSNTIIMDVIRRTNAC